LNSLQGKNQPPVKVQYVLKSQVSYLAKRGKGLECLDPSPITHQEPRRVAQSKLDESRLPGDVLSQRVRRQGKSNGQPGDASSLSKKYVKFEIEKIFKSS